MCCAGAFGLDPVGYTAPALGITHPYALARMKEASGVVGRAQACVLAPASPMCPPHCRTPLGPAGEWPGATVQQPRQRAPAALLQPDAAGAGRGGVSAGVAVLGACPSASEGILPGPPGRPAPQPPEYPGCPDMAVPGEAQGGDPPSSVRKKGWWPWVSRL